MTCTPAPLPPVVPVEPTEGIFEAILPQSLVGQWDLTRNHRTPWVKVTRRTAPLYVNPAFGDLPDADVLTEYRWRVNSYDFAANTFLTVQARRRITKERFLELSSYTDQGLTVDNFRAELPKEIARLTDLFKRRQQAAGASQAVYEAIELDELLALANRLVDIVRAELIAGSAASVSQLLTTDELLDRVLVGATPTLDERQLYRASKIVAAIGVQTGDGDPDTLGLKYSEYEELLTIPFAL